MVRNLQQQWQDLLLSIVRYCFARVFVVIVDMTGGVERLSEETGGGVEEHDIMPYKSSKSSDGFHCSVVTRVIFHNFAYTAHTGKSAAVNVINN